MKTGERNELKLVAHQRQLFLKIRNRAIVQLLSPVERRRAVVSEQLPRKLFLDSMCKAAGVLEVWFRSLAPDDIRIRSVSESARDCLVQPGFDSEETFRRSLAG